MGTIVAVVVGFVLLSFVAAGFVLVATGGVLVLRRPRSIVPPGVQKRMAADLERALEIEEMNKVKRQWMIADGYEVHE